MGGVSSSRSCARPAPPRHAQVSREQLSAGSDQLSRFWTPSVRMAKKSSDRKSLKMLFSRSDTDRDQNRDQAGRFVQNDEEDEERKDSERKRFKFPKVRLKSRSGSSSERSADVGQLHRWVCVHVRAPPLQVLVLWSSEG